ncbi:MAG: SWF/SNF helicase family protein, partial [Desulforhopalus sp.]|nr:SWF/SNF helicase family protein [Desulforhopalus sp.]
MQKFLSVGLDTLYGVSVDIVNGDTKAVSSRSERGAKSRMQIIERFEAQPGFEIIVMSPLADGVGLTVVGANDVVHLERHWNPAKEAQAADRVYRIGATKDVHVYIPLLTHPKLKSFDKNLQELLSNKIDLKDAVVSPTEVTPGDFDTEGMFG